MKQTNLPLRSTCLLALMLLFVFHGMAQMPKLHITKFELRPGDTTGKMGAHAEKDSNGDYYAIVKVKFSNPEDRASDYRFSAGAHLGCKVKPSPHNDGVWLYVQRGATFLSVMRTGYTSVVEYPLGVALAPGQVGELVVASDHVSVSTRWVVFRVDSVDAQTAIDIRSTDPGVKINKRLAINEEGTAQVALPLGSYAYSVTSDLYTNSGGIFQLQKSEDPYEELVALIPAYTIVTIHTANERADIYIDGVKKGTGSWTGKLRENVYRVECRLEGHRTSVRDIVVSGTQQQHFEVDAPKALYSSCNIMTHPVGVEVHVDGNYVGKTPRDISELLVGNHILRLTKQGYRTEIDTITIRENFRHELEYTLTKERSSARQEKSKTKKSKQPKQPKQPKPPHPIFRRYSGYLQAGAQAGTCMGFGANVGSYVYNINVELQASMIMGNEKLYVARNGDTWEEKFSATYLGAKLGYGIPVGKRFRLTPQAGVGLLSVEGDAEQISSYALCATVGLRTEFAFNRHFGISLTPEGQLAIIKKPVFEDLSNVSSKIKGWGTGYNVRLGIYYSF